LRGQGHTSGDRQQRAFAAATVASHQNSLARLQLQLFKTQRIYRGTWPTVAYMLKVKNR
jgi:hypothetical protein